MIGFCRVQVLLGLLSHRIVLTTAALAKLQPLWKDTNISVGSKLRLLNALVLSIFLYACEAWTLTAELQRKIQAIEMRSLRRLLGISYIEHITNDEVRRRVALCYDPLRTKAQYVQICT